MSYNQHQSMSAFYYSLFRLIILQIIPIEDTPTSAAVAGGAIPQMELLNNIKTIKVNLLKELTTVEATASSDKMLVPSSFYYYKGGRKDGESCSCT